MRRNGDLKAEDLQELLTISGKQIWGHEGALIR